MKYKEKYKEWIESPFFDKETKDELIKIKNDEKEIEDRFYKELEFGTAGLRGIIGSGTNRMNKYTVGKATQGLANFIKKEEGQKKGVVISYDSRNFSKEFSKVASLCLNANGIKTYVFESLRPVPELSYAVRKLGAIAGIMITASHNPAKYNGYKVYWEDGAQITSPKDNLIIEEVNNILGYDKVKTIDIEEAKKLGLYNVIGKEIDDLYIEELKKQLQNPDIVKEEKNLSIVYTPLHGAGNMPVQRILREIGFENINIVSEQEMPDGNFPTVSYPNPEDKKAFELALKLAKEKNAEIVLATDPDADRLGVYAKDSKSGEYKAFTGNMSALLIAEYILSQKYKKGTIAKNGAIIKSIVSSNMAKQVAKEYNMKLIEVLTGFKYIGEKIKEFEISNEYTYEFGYEESYGCLVGTHSRDKDAIVAVMILCEATAYYKKQGLTLWDQMVKIYEKYGFYKEEAISVTLEGVDGLEKINEIMNNLRRNIPKKFANYEVEKIRDYKLQKIIDIKTDKEENTNLPISNVLYYELNNDAWICVRPSGTEPKIKYYIGVKGNSFKDAEEKINELKKGIRNQQ
ncbi:MAG: phospho-sugar mutase [Clostridia bacterium]|nr:phospho-sugar mutase [Clostridia bacterium]